MQRISRLRTLEESIHRLITSNVEADSTFLNTPSGRGLSEAISSIQSEIRLLSKETFVPKRYQHWTCSNFKGPEPLFALIVARDKEQAKALLEIELAKRGMLQTIPTSKIEEAKTLKPVVKLI